MTGTRLGRKLSESSGVKEQETEKKMKKKTPGTLWYTNPLERRSISQSGANSCQSVFAISLRGQQQQQGGKIQVEIKSGPRVHRCNTGEETGTQMLTPRLPLVFL